MNKIPELLPCPFCGGKADIHKGYCAHFNGGQDYFYPSCKNGKCPGATVPDDEFGYNTIMAETKEEARKIWNTRSYPQEVLEAIEKQKPKKPNKDIVHYRCPNCDAMLNTYETCNCCNHCGQKLDWSDV